MSPQAERVIPVDDFTYQAFQELSEQTGKPINELANTAANLMRQQWSGGSDASSPSSGTLNSGSVRGKGS
jgi:hypothetical protein